MIKLHITDSTNELGISEGSDVIYINTDFIQMITNYDDFTMIEMIETVYNVKESIEEILTLIIDDQNNQNFRRGYQEQSGAYLAHIRKEK